jgi:hypothetical protein
MCHPADHEHIFVWVRTSPDTPPDPALRCACGQVCLGDLDESPEPEPYIWQAGDEARAQALAQEMFPAEET